MPEPGYRQPGPEQPRLGAGQAEHIRQQRRRAREKRVPHNPRPSPHGPGGLRREDPHSDPGQRHLSAGRAPRDFLRKTGFAALSGGASVRIKDAAVRYATYISSWNSTAVPVQEDRAYSGSAQARPGRRRASHGGSSAGHTTAITTSGWLPVVQPIGHAPALLRGGSVLRHPGLNPGGDLGHLVRVGGLRPVVPLCDQPGWQRLVGERILRRPCPALKAADGGTARKSRDRPVTRAVPL